MIMWTRRVLHDSVCSCTSCMWTWFLVPGLHLTGRTTSIVVLSLYCALSIVVLSMHKTIFLLVWLELSIYDDGNQSHFWKSYFSHAWADWLIAMVISVTVGYMPWQTYPNCSSCVWICQRFQPGWSREPWLQHCQNVNIPFIPGISIFGHLEWEPMFPFIRFYWTVAHFLLCTSSGSLLLGFSSLWIAICYSFPFFSEQGWTLFCIYPLFSLQTFL